MLNSFTVYSSLLLLALSCGQRSALEFSPGVKSTESLTALEFETVQKQVFSSSCVTCHSQYKTFEGVKREIDQIKNSIEHFRMPKNSRLSQNKRNLLLGWIAVGAPEFKNDLPGNYVPTVLETKWKSLSENLFVPKCVVCHNPYGQAKFLDLSTKEVVVAAQDRRFGKKKLLDVASPKDSYLLEVLNDRVEPMPPILSNLPRLKDDEINLIEKWIELNLP
jgi:hypothetical protein